MLDRAAYAGDVAAVRSWVPCETKGLALGEGSGRGGELKRRGCLHSGCWPCTRVMPRWPCTRVMPPRVCPVSQVRSALLRGNVDANTDISGDGSGYTALHRAAAEGQLGVLQLLLEWGARTDLADTWGKCAADYATPPALAILHAAAGPAARSSTLGAMLQEGADQLLRSAEQVPPPATGGATAGQRARRLVTHTCARACCARGRKRRERLCHSRCRACCTRLRHRRPHSVLQKALPWPRGGVGALISRSRCDAH